MALLKELRIFLWAILTNWASLCTGGVVIALIWFWSTLKQLAVPRNVGLGVAAGFLVIAIFNAWREQYHMSISYERQLDDLSKPMFVIDRHGTFGTPIDANNALLVVTMRVKNLGAQSVIDKPQVEVVNTEGTVIQGQWIGVPAGPINLTQPDGTVGSLTPDKFLMLLAGSIPIPHNGAVEGFLWVRLPGVQENKLVGCMVKATIADITGKTYAVESFLGDKNLNVFPSPYPVKRQ